jgi:hypothetical protein
MLANAHAGKHTAGNCKRIKTVCYCRHFNFFRSPEAEALLLKNDAKLLRHLLSQRESDVVTENYVADLTRPGRLTGGGAPVLQIFGVLSAC